MRLWVQIVFSAILPIYFRQQIGRQCYCTASAAAASRMGILALRVKDQHTAVQMPVTDIIAMFSHQFQKNLLSHFPQISGDNGIIICGLPVKILQMLTNGITAAGAMQAPYSWNP